MTETECFNCDYSENCEWELILKNTVPMSPNCKAKAWHDRSLKQFDDMTDCLREKIYGGGEEVKRAEWDDWKYVYPGNESTSPPLGYSETVRNKLPDLPKLEINPNDVRYISIHTGKTWTVGGYYKACQTTNWDAMG